MTISLGFAALDAVGSIVAFVGSAFVFVGFVVVNLHYQF
jgi:hypothetical protein